MRKKLGFLIAAGAVVALLQWAVPSADSAVSEVKEEAVQECPMQKSCPADKAGCDKASKTSAGETGECPEKSSCPASGTKV